MTRISLLFYSGHYAQIGQLEFLKILFIGFLSDLVFFTLIFPIFLLIQALFTRKVRNCLSFVHFSAALTFILVFFLSMNLIAEIAFWEEYGTRYNFIALDYLIYSNRFSSILFESVTIILITIFVIFFSALVVKLMMPRLRVACCSINNFHNLLLIAIFSALSLFALVNDNSNLASFFDNKISDNLAKNGFSELSRAFSNSEPNYAEFYPKLPEIEVEKIVEHVKIEKVSHNLQKVHTEKYNVVLVVVESLNAEFLNQNLTPNLYEISQGSLTFANIYASGTRTTRGIEALTRSALPAPGSSIIYSPEKNIFNISSILEENGYQNFFAYGGYSYFDNLNRYFRNDRYEILDRAKFTSGEVSFANIWGVADADLFTKSLEYMDDFNSRSKPFFSMILTTSSHFPYTIPSGKVNVDGLEPALAAIKYTDYAFGEFIASARKKSWFKDTIFVITSDHCLISKQDKIVDISKYHIPLMIYAPGIIQAEQNNHLASQIDVAPTILGLLGVEYNNYGSFGVDLMRNNPKRAFIGTYQMLGYLKEEPSAKHLVLLSPQSEAKTFVEENGVMVPRSDDKLVREAISFFQKGLDRLH